MRHTARKQSSDEDKNDYNNGDLLSSGLILTDHPSGEHYGWHGVGS